MAIFPVISGTGISGTGIESVSVKNRGINFLFDFNLGDFVLKDGKFIEVTGDAGVAFWIEKTLRTEFEQSSVYKNTGYGTISESLKGSVLPKEIAKNIFESNIKNSLLKHERINSINNFKFKQIEDKVIIEFEVELNLITDVEQNQYSKSNEGFTRLSTLEDIKYFLGIKLLTNQKFYFKTNLGQQVFIN